MSAAIRCWRKYRLAFQGCIVFENADFSYRLKNKTSGKKLKKDDIEKIIAFLNSLDNVYVKLAEAKKKLFLKLLVSKIYVKNKQISQVKYTPIFQSIIDKDLVRITTNWLPLRELIRTLESLINTSNVLDCQRG